MINYSKAMLKERKMKGQVYIYELPRCCSFLKRKVKWIQKFAILSKKMFKIYKNETLDQFEAIIDFDLLTCDLLSDEESL